jgi:hypothetical protein
VPPERSAGFLVARIRAAPCSAAVAVGGIPETESTT